MASKMRWKAPLGLAAWGDSDDEEIEPGYFVITTACFVSKEVHAPEGTSTNNSDIVGLLNIDAVVHVSEVVNNGGREQRIRGKISSPLQGWISLKSTRDGFWWVERTTSQMYMASRAPLPDIRSREIHVAPVPRPPPPPAPMPPVSTLPVMRGGQIALRRRMSSLFDDDCSDHLLSCGLRWTVRETDGRQDPIDVDISALKFRKDGRYLNSVYFAETEDTRNGIYHSGDEISGASDEDGKKDSERISFTTSSFQPNLDAIVIVGTIFSSGVHNFSDVNNFSAHVLDLTANRELCQYRKEDVGQGNSIIVAIIYRRGKKWAFKAIDEAVTIPEHATARSMQTLPEILKHVHEAGAEHVEALRQGV